MNIDYQVIINTISTLMAFAFPIALVFMICQKLVGIFVSFVFGKEVNF